MSQPYLFYSDRCANSKQIIETLKALNKAGLYKFIDALSLQPAQRPAWLKSVPTLYVPDTKEVIVGKDIYGYIAKPTNSRKELPAKPVEGGANPQNQIGELSAWGFEGMGRLSESYSLWDTPSQFASGGGSMYTFLDGSTSNTPTPGGVPSSGGPASKNTIDDKNKSATNADVMKRMEQMTAQREKEFGVVERK
uniref:Glutaredoxin domain-containing protein n=1 Tax=viral metagenome TaxID=1070528 RepID=A0A6C0AJN7_9ZZZZ